MPFLADFDSTHFRDDSPECPSLRRHTPDAVDRWWANARLVLAVVGLVGGCLWVVFGD